MDTPAENRDSVMLRAENSAPDAGTRALEVLHAWIKLMCEEQARIAALTDTAVKQPSIRREIG
jgi:hypothetical protein